MANLPSPYREHIRYFQLGYPRGDFFDKSYSLNLKLIQLRPWVIISI